MHLNGCSQLSRPMLRIISTVVFCILAISLFAQRQVTRTPALDSLQEILGGHLLELENLLLQDPTQPGILQKFATHLDDERPWLYELGYHGTFSQTFGRKVAEMLRLRSNFINLRVTDSLTTTELTGFLEEYGSQIIFSPFLDRFTEVPLAEREVEYRLLEPRPKPNLLGNLDYQKQEIARRLENGHYGDVARIIGKIGQFKTPEAYRFLEECADGKHWGKDVNKEEKYVYANICESLGEFPTLESAKLILRIAEEHDLAGNDFIITPLAKITNLHFRGLDIAREDQLGWYRTKMADYPTLRDQISHGYDLMAPYTITDYEALIDYYGNLLLSSRYLYLPWINEHAINDAIATGNPISLAIVGTQITHQPQQTDGYGSEVDLNIPRLLESLTGVTVEVRTAEGEWTDQYPDEYSRTQYAAYWMQYFEDYTWDDDTQRYFNGVDLVTPLDSISYWFDQLYQPLKEPALTAFFHLTEQDSARVGARMTHYDMSFMSDDFSEHLSSFSNRFLPQLTRLSAWYRTEGIDYSLSPRLQFLVDRLFREMPANDRLWLEDSIISILRPEEVIPFEYHFIIWSNDTWILRNGQSRILDRWYGRNWQALMREPLELRAYLKRAYHYDLLGIIGNQNKYTQRFRDAGPELMVMLRKVRDTDADRAIRSQAVLALTFAESSGIVSSIRSDSAEIAREVAAFMELPAPSASDFSVILHRKGLTSGQRSNVLTRLAFLTSCTDIVNIRFDNAEVPVRYFTDYQGCSFDLRGVSLMLGIFEKVGPDRLLAFVNDQSRSFSLQAKGEMYYYLLYNTDFKDWVRDDVLPFELRKELEPALENRLVKLEKWKDFERDDLMMMLEDLRFGDRPKAERIERVLSDTSIANPKETLSNILESAGYSDLPKISDVLASVQIERFSWTTLLIHDWGIPLLFPDSIALLHQLAADLRDLPEEELYWKYLEPYQLRFKPDGEWNFLRVYDILEFDIVDGFVGGGGGRLGNEYVYALIRLLELEFGTRLEEPRKFNNMINSSTFSRAKRASKWQRYLLEKGLVKLPADYVRSISNLTDH